MYEWNSIFIFMHHRTFLITGFFFFGAFFPLVFFPVLFLSTFFSRISYCHSTSVATSVCCFPFYSFLHKFCQRTNTVRYGKMNMCCLFSGYMHSGILNYPSLICISLVLTTGYHNITKSECEQKKNLTLEL